MERPGSYSSVGAAHSRVLVVYDTARRASVTGLLAGCLAEEFRRLGAGAEACRVGGCPQPWGYRLVVVGAPVYYERPLGSVTRFLDRHGGLAGARVAVYIVCLAAGLGPVGEAAARRYLGLLLSHVRGEVVSWRVFRGMIRVPERLPDRLVEECRGWARLLLGCMGPGRRPA